MLYNNPNTKAKYNKREAGTISKVYVNRAKLSKLCPVQGRAYLDRVVSEAAAFFALVLQVP